MPALFWWIYWSSEVLSRGVRGCSSNLISTPAHTSLTSSGFQLFFPLFVLQLQHELPLMFAYIPFFSPPRYFFFSLACFFPPIRSPCSQRLMYGGRSFLLLPPPLPLPLLCSFVLLLIFFLETPPPPRMPFFCSPSFLFHPPESVLSFRGLSLCSISFSPLPNVFLDPPRPFGRA